MASYEKQEWINSPTQTTPINATRLNHIEDGIENAYEFDKTGCKVISSATNVEAAIKELDASNDAINSNLSALTSTYTFDENTNLSDAINYIANRTNIGKIFTFLRNNDNWYYGFIAVYQEYRIMGILMNSQSKWVFDGLKDNTITFNQF